MAAAAAACVCVARCALCGPHACMGRPCQQVLHAYSVCVFGHALQVIVGQVHMQQPIVSQRRPPTLLRLDTRTHLAQSRSAIHLLLPPSKHKTAPRCAAIRRPWSAHTLLLRGMRSSSPSRLAFDLRTLLSICPFAPLFLRASAGGPHAAARCAAVCFVCSSPSSAPGAPPLPLLRLCSRSVCAAVLFWRLRSL